MHIAQIDTGYLPPLERATFDCDKQVNLFIGPNASGKSTILRAIKGVHSLAASGGPPPPRDGDHGDPGRITNVPAGEDSVGDLYLNYDSVIEGEPLFALKASDDWPRDDFWHHLGRGAFPAHTRNPDQPAGNAHFRPNNRGTGGCQFSMLHWNACLTPNPAKSSTADT